MARNSPAPADSAPSRRPQRQTGRPPRRPFRTGAFFARLGRILLRLALFLGLPAAMVWGGFCLRDAAMADNSVFRVAHIVVTTDGELTTDQILASARVSTNASLFACKPAEIRERLEANPMVAHALVTRQLPNTLRMNVTERVPVARIVIRDGPPSLAIDRESHVMGPRSVSTALPLVLGLNDRALIPGDVSRDPLLPDLMAIIQEANSPELRGKFAIRALDIRDRSRIRLVLDTGEEVLLSTKNYLPKLHQLPIIRGVAKERGLSFRTYDMTVDRSFPAR